MTHVKVIVLVCLLAGVANAINIETVLVGDPGNAGELSGAGAGGHGEDRICGAVGYTYSIGKFEVTGGQYLAFLNAVGGVDTYGLYNQQMYYVGYQGLGCAIRRNNSGVPGDPFTYTMVAGNPNRPVNFVSWGDAVRFANWLHNGQPAGRQDASTTEDGSYAINGATSSAALAAVTRKATATWVIPSEDEWYKAAYYKGGSTDAGYWDYATGSDERPGRDLTDTSGNNANYYLGSGPYPYPIDSGNYTTVVGEFQNSDSPYGTFDQCGNLFEWNESLAGYARGSRGGSYGYWTGYTTQASGRYHFDSASEYDDTGFRLAYVPEPCSALMLVVGAFGLASGRRRG